MVKKAIESLIDREFIQRNSQDLNKIYYLAWYLFVYLIKIYIFYIYFYDFNKKHNLKAIEQSIFQIFKNYDKLGTELYEKI